MALKEEIVRTAREIIGVPWIHQGRDPKSGLDCLGFLIYIGKKIGYLEPDFDYNTYHTDPDGLVLIEELRKKMDEISIKDLDEGDIPVIRMPNEKLPRHVGILAKGTFEMNIIHALREKTIGKVVEEPYRRWRKYTTHAFRFREEVDS
jgi:cell wall-associated NlpC family hydrolase